MLPSVFQTVPLLMFVTSTFATFDANLNPFRDFSRDIIALEARKVDPGPSTNLPPPWIYQGCYTDGNPRTLPSASYANTTGMTVETCIGFCASQYWIYAGTEYAQECCRFPVLQEYDIC